MRYNMNLEKPPVIDYICRLSSDAVLCWGELDYSLTGKDVLTLVGADKECAVHKPYFGSSVVENGRRYTLLLLSIKEKDLPQRIDNLTITSSKKVLVWEFAGDRNLAFYNEQFVDFISALSHATVRKILFLLMKFLSLRPVLSQDGQFSSLCWQTQEYLRAVAADGTKSSYRDVYAGSSKSIYQIQDSILLQDVEVSGAISDDIISAVVITPRQIQLLSAHCVRLPSKNNRGGGVKKRLLSIIGAHDGLIVGASTVTGGVLYMGKKNVFLIRDAFDGVVSGADEIAALLKSFEVKHAMRLREHIAYTLLNEGKKLNVAKVTSFLTHMQTCYGASASQMLDRDIAIGSAVELLTLAGKRDLLIGGWLYDPLERVGRIELISDLGFVLDITDNLFWYRRNDIEELYEDSSYGVRGTKAGFIATIELPEKIRTRLSSYKLALRGWRVRLITHGGGEYSVMPNVVGCDALLAKEKLLNDVLPLLEHDDDALSVAYAGLLKVHRQVVETAQADDVRRYGGVISAPRVSVIIPLTGDYRFINAQISHFSNDPFMARCEVIYVLNHRQDVAKVRKILREAHNLYGFSPALLVMEREVGYAACVNLAAEQAQGEELLLLDASCLPVTYGWLEDMRAFYREQTRVGVLGVKMLRDNSTICHAGGTFVREGDGWVPRALWNGYPLDYPEAQKRQEVTLISGSCMIIGRKLFLSVGGMSTDYLVRGFEDSDLCMSVRKKGRYNYYLPDISMLWLDESIVNGRCRAQQPHAYRLSALLYQARWRDDIIAIQDVEQAAVELVQETEGRVDVRAE